MLLWKDNKLARKVRNLDKCVSVAVDTNISRDDKEAEQNKN